jgi:membrane protease YdiL (CAAX protease family)
MSNGHKMHSSDSTPLPSKPTPVTWWQLGLAPLVGLIVGAVLAVGITLAWMAVRSQGLIPFGAASASSNSAFFFNMALIAVLYLPMIGMMWWSARRLTPAPLTRFLPRLPARTVLTAFATGIIAALACMAFEEAVSRGFQISFEMSPAERGFYPANLVQLGAAVVAMAFIGPFAEELYFRGFLLQWLRQRMTDVPAVALSAVAFAIIHLFMLLHPGASGWVTTGEIFAVGLLMGFWVVRTGSLWSSYAVHIGYNLVVVLQPFIAAS